MSIRITTPLFFLLFVTTLFVKGQERLYFPELRMSGVWYASFAEDGNYAIVTTYDEHTYLFDLAKKSQTGILPKEEKILQGVFHPDGKSIGLLMASGKVHLWDWQAGKAVYSWDEPPHREYYGIYGPIISFDNAGKLMAFPGGTGSQMKVADLKSGNIISTFEEETFCAIALSPNGDYIAGSIEDGSKVYNVPSGKEMLHIEPGSGHSFVVWHPDGSQIHLTGITGGPCRSYHFPTGEKLIERSGTGTAADLNPVVVSDDGETIFLVDATDDYGIKLFKTRSNQPFKTLSHPQQYPSSFFHSNSQNKFYAFSGDGGLAIWDMNAMPAPFGPDQEKASALFEKGYEKMTGFFYEEAFELYKAGYKYDTVSMHPKAMLAYLYTQSPDKESRDHGFRMATNLLKKYPDETLIQVMIGKIIMEGGACETAIEMFVKALKEYPGPREDLRSLYFYIGMCLSKIEAYDTAILYLNQYKDMDYGDSRFTEFFMFYEDQFRVDELIIELDRKAGK